YVGFFPPCRKFCH
ncbi:hypothetical protein D039_2005B, partial [Vibrio parahaemolyticus EKP-028]